MTKKDSYGSRCCLTFYDFQKTSQKLIAFTAREEGTQSALSRSYNIFIEIFFFLQ
jgi:hypothetical protein